MTKTQEPLPGTMETAVIDGQTRVVLAGRLSLRDVSRLRDLLMAQPDDRPLTIDLEHAAYFDTSIAWAIGRKRQRMDDAGSTLTLENVQPRARQVLDTVFEAIPRADVHEPETRGLLDTLEALGRGVADGLATFAEGLNLFGIFLQRSLRSVLRPRQFRFTALVHHCEATGLSAVFIVALLSFLIGVVLAYQGASQLRQFGAEIFVVDLIAISILRELGILLTAIIVAGRTASSYTAAIGSMKMREEIDAMQTLGIDPADALVVPRVLALVLMLPILGLISNLAGLVGGALMAWIELGISPSMFRVRLLEGTDVSHVLVGMVKAPVFAVIIGVIGCQAGLRVSGTAESLGRMTSTAVVAAIFAVIVVDALFSVFFARIGI